jgi:hypothetical protein
MLPSQTQTDGYRFSCLQYCPSVDQVIVMSVSGLDRKASQLFLTVCESIYPGDQSVLHVTSRIT